MKALQKQMQKKAAYEKTQTETENSRLELEESEREYKELLDNPPDDAASEEEKAIWNRAVNDAKLLVEKLKELNDQLSKTLDAKLAVWKEAQDSAAKAEQIFNEAEAAADLSQAAADRKMEYAKQLQSQAEQMKSYLQDASIQTGGNLLLNAGGEEIQNLSLDVGKNVTVQAPDARKLILRSLGQNLNLKKIEIAEDAKVEILADGNVINAQNQTDSDANLSLLISADSITINSLNGNIGTNKSPITLKVKKIDSAMGKDIYITNEGDLLIGNIHANPETGSVHLRIIGNLSGEEAEHLLTGGSIELNVTGNVGGTKTPIRTNTDRLIIKARKINIDNTALRVDISDTSGNDVSIKTDGHLFGERVVAEILSFGQLEISC